MMNGATLMVLENVEKNNLNNIKVLHGTIDDLEDINLI